jgi:hypothetical protein
VTTAVTSRVHFAVAGRGRRSLRAGVAPERAAVGPGRVPRVSRLLALAIKFDRLIASGAITDQAELARIGHVTRARVTQIMNLLHLAPDIQETLLLLEPVTQGRDPISERDMRPIAAEARWDTQRAMFEAVAAN